MITSHDCEAKIGDEIQIGEFYTGKISQIHLNSENLSEAKYQLLTLDPPIYLDDENLVDQSLLPICLASSDLLTSECKLVRPPILSSFFKGDDLLPLETDMSLISNEVCNIFMNQNLKPDSNKCYSEVFQAAKHLNSQFNPHPVNCDTNGLIFCKRTNLGSLEDSVASEIWYLAGIVDFYNVCKELVFNSIRLDTDQDLLLY